MNLQNLRDYLADSPAINDEVEGRFYYQVARQGTPYPYVVFQEFNELPAAGLDGVVGSRSVTVQIDVWVLEEAEVRGYALGKRIADAIENRMTGYRGLMEDTHVSDCQMVRRTPGLESFDDRGQSSGTDYRKHRVSMDFEIIYRSTLPDFT